jgi:hypothetical protein
MQERPKPGPDAGLLVSRSWQSPPPPKTCTTLLRGKLDDRLMITPGLNPACIKIMYLNRTYFHLTSLTQLRSTLNTTSSLHHVAPSANKYSSALIAVHTSYGINALESGSTELVTVCECLLSLTTS